MVHSPLSPLQSFIVVTSSFVIASVVTVYPMGFTAATFRPMALMMVLAFWLIHQPRHIGVGISFLVGLIADLLLDTRLGQQAFAAVVMALSVRFMGSYLRQMDLPIAWLLASSALIIFGCTLWLVQYISQNTFIASGFVSLIISIITWPLVYTALIRFSR